MHAPAPLPLTRDLVLVGGGHTHALILKAWGMKPLPGVRLTVIDPGPTTAYSGMLPGHVAGHYDRTDLDIDLVRLARFAGARLVQGAAEGLDLPRQEIRVSGRPAVGFDVASLDIGVASEVPDLMGFAAHGVPAKPLGPFAARWQAFVADDRTGDAAVIGAGIAGTELALAMAHRLRGTGRRVHLVEAREALSDVPNAVRQKLLAEVLSAGIILTEGAEIARVDAHGLVLSTGRRIPARFVTGAAGARPQPWLERSGLDLVDGFVAVNARLESSFRQVFAAGDCAHYRHAPRPKAGVYAVRAAPVLLNNLRTAVGHGGFRRFRPQGDYLKLVSLGRKDAIGTRGPFRVSGPWVWRWKDRIDRRFMEKLSKLPAMPPAPLPWPRAQDMRAAMGPKPLCGGCGAKVGRATLQRALSRLGPHERDDVVPVPGDDAAILKTGGARQVLSSDHLRALVDDPVAMTRIAAVHALGDIWSMGAAPQAATVNLVLPRLADTLAARTLTEILEAAEAVLRAEGAEIVGGHSSVGDELTIGFSLTGLCERDPITHAGGKPGDALILTKPIGSGTVLAAEMALDARGGDVAAALTLMTRSEGAAARILGAAHAMTDVTGFGLAGHLTNIAEASGTGVELWLHAIPHLPGARSLAARGVRSTLYPQNRMVAPDLPETPDVALLFDPQTAGGLVAAVAPEDASRLLQELHDAGYPEAAQIGWLTASLPGQIDVTD
ncbi:selenide, water dikinase SelD [Roseivivax marinus]|uniref:selenide, water dikinase SelD n=1 Tax=Roseivivax marinus TaxID=1379903 RepID=UPI0027402D6C|nr:selenide, water dikinase SelD [Roseivivax marinus]